MRAVLDTNVLISAFTFPGGTPEDVYRLGLDERIGLATSAPLLAEFSRILVDKFGWSPAKARDAVAQVARVATVVTPTEHVTVIAADPNDDRVLEAAQEARADAIVSGDKHLLRLGSWREIRIVRPAEFLAEFESR